MSSPPTVSVLVTVYNREAYLEACVESILQSTFEDLEVIMVDDCSTDSSAALMKDIAAKDSRVQAYFNAKNLRDYPNRNRAASLAQGKYIKYVDADDLIYPHSLAIMVEAMEAHPDAALGLSHSDLQAEKPYPWLISPKEAYHKHFLERGCLSCGPSGAIMRRNAFNDVGCFQAFGVASDNDMWLRLAARWPVILFPPSLVWWRVHEGQEFRSAPAQKEYLVLGHQAVINALQSPECPLSSTDSEMAKRRVQQHHARRILALALKSRNLSLARSAYRDSKLTFSEMLTGLKAYY
ncbi:glycosyltransferase family 2 protein [Cerasicoccus arenae]|uniref:Glycosyltransferase 2-like domain-containing protein n=1 Tax=Cerasicoccus arenae TaxID=424488 RepID=A0A8J3D9L1_9BACT|nr:glycosyltransferase family 2 protein [Cerasicoccus arenae]MBK1857042.1 glycosyltransferase family 2 protein [Cerasicoccus arenae]GHB92028.1 hypothetical protein GCM10007047_03760 [Cerasicoccus arenae]